MMRLLFISTIGVVVAYFVLQSRLTTNSTEKPIFLQTDEIAHTHQTLINTKIHSLIEPDSFQLETLKTDYSNLWAHLNHLYTTNDIETGKEYYTEDWFKQLNNQYTGKTKAAIVREDKEHNLHIINWDDDNLLCTAIDSNAVLCYYYPDKTIKKTKATLAIVLLLQGDHWRVDALRVISENDADETNRPVKDSVSIIHLHSFNTKQYPPQNKKSSL
jgi:hypothetical protein